MACAHEHRTRYTDCLNIGGRWVGGLYARCLQCGYETLDGRSLAELRIGAGTAAPAELEVQDPGPTRCPWCHGDVADGVHIMTGRTTCDPGPDPLALPYLPDSPALNYKKGITP